MQAFNNSGTSKIKGHIFRLTPGEDLFKRIEAYIKLKDIKAGFIMTCVGSLQKINIRLANADKFLVKEEHYEITSLTGCVSSNDRFHLHITLCDEDGQAIGGHLCREGNVVYTTAEVVIGELEELEISEVKNEGEDWPEIKISKKI